MIDTAVMIASEGTPTDKRGVTVVVLGASGVSVAIIPGSGWNLTHTVPPEVVVDVVIWVVLVEVVSDEVVWVGSVVGVDSVVTVMVVVTADVWDFVVDDEVMGVNVLVEEVLVVDVVVDSVATRMRSEVGLGVVEDVWVVVMMAFVLDDVGVSRRVVDVTRVDSVVEEGVVEVVGNDVVLLIPPSGDPGGEE
jgi:hypothetical protein